MLMKSIFCALVSGSKSEHNTWRKDIGEDKNVLLPGVGKMCIVKDFMERFSSHFHGEELCD